MVPRWIGLKREPRSEFGGERGDYVLDLGDFAAGAEICSGGVGKGEEGEEKEVATKGLHDDEWKQTTISDGEKYRSTSVNVDQTRLYRK
jgi:hypothetical protein